jgi:hypothetical protein
VRVCVHARAPEASKIGKIKLKRGREREEINEKKGKESKNEGKERKRK